MLTPGSWNVVYVRAVHLQKVSRGRGFIFIDFNNSGRWEIILYMGTYPKNIHYRWSKLCASKSNFYGKPITQIDGDYF